MRRTLFLAFFIFGCGVPTRETSPLGSHTTADADAGLVVGGGPGSPDIQFVYANTPNELYQIDPDTLKLSKVGTFDVPNGESMTDIAIDAQGALFGITSVTLYKIDKQTAHCTHLTNFSLVANALSFLPSPNGPEKLVAAGTSGEIIEINPSTGATTPIGAYGSGYGSSGDLVSVTGLGTLATVFGPTSDLLVRVADNGTATQIGPTGVSSIWGLGFWRDKLFGFTAGGQFVLIDPKTGAATTVQTDPVSWYGAAVSTSAHVIQ